MPNPDAERREFTSADGTSEIPERSWNDLLREAAGLAHGAKEEYDSLMRNARMLRNSAGAERIGILLTELNDRMEKLTNGN